MNVKNQEGLCSYVKVQQLVNADKDELLKIFESISKLNEVDKHELFLGLLAYARVCTEALDRMGIMVKV